MDLQELLDIIQSEGGKIVIIENGKPRAVVMAFDEWRRKKAAGERASQTNDRLEAVQAPDFMPPDPGEEELSIDDLPL